MQSMEIPEEPGKGSQQAASLTIAPPRKTSGSTFLAGAGLLACAGLWAGWATSLLLLRNPGLNAACLFVLAGAGAALVTLFLLGVGVRRARAYRAGLLSALAGCVVSAAGGMLPALMGAAGALAGVFTLTSLREGLWEDNLPPSREMQDEVYRLHREKMGEPRAGSIPKRLFDIGLSAVGLVTSLPLFLLIAIAVWYDDPGPVLFVKNSVGRGGRNFRQFKFRTMVREAEKATGPVLSSETDERVLWPGRFLRKTALDELPQLINILVGEMSFVGPRPQRTVLVRGYLEQIPGYTGRHEVAPGLAGLAQVVGSYFMPPEEKLTWDLRYIQKASLLYDFKLVVIALLVVFWLRWQKGWDEHIPERWLS